MNPLSFKYLTHMTQRRALRLFGMLCIAIAFVLLQLWQTNGKVLPQTTPESTEAPINRYYTGSTTNTTEALVVRAVDGDTLDVKVQATGEEVKIRLLGINTPESVDPRRPVQCFGKEASHHMKDLVEGKTVLLVEDLKADDRDKYGRWLRNVVRKDDLLDVNATLLVQGYATSYLSFPLDGKRKAELRALEEDAKTNLRGLWSPSTCEGKK